MKKIIIVPAILVLLLVIFFLFGNKSDASRTRGEVISVNLEGLAFDGPALVTLKTNEGQVVVAVPSMGRNLCAARDNIADVSTIVAGDKVKVKGKTDEQGRIVPCEDASHYFELE